MPMSRPSSKFPDMFRRLLCATLLAIPLALPIHAAEPAAFPL
jgi:hypothetical protein